MSDYLLCSALFGLARFNYRTVSIILLESTVRSVDRVTMEMPGVAILTPAGNVTVDKVKSKLNKFVKLTNQCGIGKYMQSLEIFSLNVE